MKEKAITDHEFQKIIQELIENEDVQQMKNYIQHFNTDCYEHCYNVAYLSYLISKKMNWNYKSSARAGMLHDLFLYNWRTRLDDRKGLHAFTHAKQACKNASKLFELTKKEQNMIKRHMFPVTIIPPTSKEGILLTIIDKYCTIYEFKKYLSEKAILKKLIKIQMD